MNKRNARHINFYQQGHIPTVKVCYQLWAVDEDRLNSFAPASDAVYGEKVKWSALDRRLYGNTDHSKLFEGIVPSDTTRFRVSGEYEHSWCELLEIASYFNAERNGYFYYAGHPVSAAILLPTWEEIRFIVEFHKQFPQANLWSIEERYAMTLMIGGNWASTLR